MTIAQTIRPITAKTWFRTTAPSADADRGPRRGHRRRAEHEPEHVARPELERDVAHREDRVADAEGEPDRGEPEEDAHQQARGHLGGDDAGPVRRDDERRSDRAVPELARDRHHSDQRGEQRGGGAGREEHVLVVVCRELVRVSG